MANATSIVKRGALRVTEEFFEHSAATLAAATSFWPHAMVGLVGGYLAKFDDTQSLKFFGILRDDSQGQALPISTAGDGTGNLNVHQAKAFALAISAVAITDIGRRVYALDDQTGTLDPSATTFANLVGVVKDLVYATDNTAVVAGYALVAPIYDLPNGAQTQVFTGNGAIQVKASTVFLTKGSAAAMTIADPTSGTHDGMQVDIVSTTAFAHVIVAPSGFNASGTTATFTGAKGNNVVLRAFGGKWYVQSSVNTTLS